MFEVQKRCSKCGEEKSLDKFPKVKVRGNIYYRNSCNDGNYTLENCRFIEKSENSAKDKRKPVLQYDLQGNFIREFISVMEANRYFGKPGSHINDVANNKRSQALGYLWRYK